jgi:hypothetical protein
MAIDIPGMLNTLIGDYAQAKSDRQARYGQGLQLMQDAIAQFQPGGAFEQSAMNLYQQGKRNTMASGMQSLVSSGLAGTSNPMVMNKKYEEDVGNPFRMNLAAEQSSRLGSALQNAAGDMSSFQDIYPDAGTLSYLATGGFGALTNDWLALQKVAAQNSAQTEANRAATPMPTLAPQGGSSGGDLSSISSPFSSYSSGNGGVSGVSGGNAPYEAPNIQWSTPMMGTSSQWVADTGGGMHEPGQAPTVSQATSGIQHKWTLLGTQQSPDGSGTVYNYVDQYGSHVTTRNPLT